MSEFYEYLKNKITDKKSAQKFIDDYRENDNPDLGKFGCFSTRALCYHVSNVLEDKEEIPEYTSNYMSTKYGSALFFSELR